MRIAVLVYGRLNKCDKHYENIIESIGKDHEIDFFVSSDNAPEKLLNLFIKIYKPVSYINTSIHYDYDLSNYPGRRDETKIHNMTCHFINKNRVLELLENHIKSTNIMYDLVFSLRIDCLFETKFMFMYHGIEENTIYIPEGSDFTLNGLNDQIAYGTLDVMRKYNSINPIFLLEQKLSIPHPESLNYANIQFHRLNVKRVHVIYILDR